MVSVCATCKGLQKHLRGLDGSQEAETEKSQWIDATLPVLRTSAGGGCRACALVLNGILLHHDRFAGQKEDRVKIKAESFNPRRDKSPQDHLSVEVRWKEHDESGESPDDEHEQAPGYPDLKLEFFTDGGK